jgi:PII-like signaling protein
MLKPGPAKRLTVILSETERWHGRSTHLALVELFRHKRLAGATVTRGLAGFAGGGPIHTMHLADVIIDLPVRIEVVDTAEAIDRVLADVYDMVEHGLVEIQATEVVKFAPRKGGAEPEPAREDVMRLIGKAKLLQIHVGQRDVWEGEPLYEAIVKRARQLDIAGATVYRGILGYGAHKRIRKHKTLALSQDDPILVTVIDAEDKINKLLAQVDGMVSGGCLIAISDTTVVKYAEHPEEAAVPAADAGTKSG